MTQLTEELKRYTEAVMAEMDRQYVERLMEETYLAEIQRREEAQEEEV